MSIAITLTLIACLTAGFFDVRSRRIPNWLTGATALAAIAVHASGGWKALLISLGVMIALTVAGTVIYSFGGIGGGDVKLAIATSGLLSYPLFVPFLLYTAIGGGLLALAILVRRGRARAALTRMAMTASGAVPGLPPDQTETLPYAVAFAFGATLIALAHTVAPFLRITL